MKSDAIPVFSSEEEEATWWDAHPEAITRRFRKAREEGRVRRLSQTNLPGASETILHQALDAEEKQLADS